MRLVIPPLPSEIFFSLVLIFPLREKRCSMPFFWGEGRGTLVSVLLEDGQEGDGGQRWRQQETLFECQEGTNKKSLFYAGNGIRKHYSGRGNLDIGRGNKTMSIEGTVVETKRLWKREWTQQKGGGRHPPIFGFFSLPADPSHLRIRPRVLRKPFFVRVFRRKSTIVSRK